MEAEREGKSSNVWWPMEREGEGCHAWWLMEREGEGSNVFTQTFIFSFDLKLLIYHGYRSLLMHFFPFP
jgi:hypothetical protein